MAIDPSAIERMAARLRNCDRKPYQKIKAFPTFQLDRELIAYASPDSTYAVTRRLLLAAQRSILIGIYDLSADYMRDLLIERQQQGVKVSLMLDINSSEERETFVELGKNGCRTVQAPSCSNKHGSYFKSSHEKVIVVDDEWTMVQSGNYTKASIPPNQDGGVGDFVKGNRDMGIAVRSGDVAGFFTEVLESDMRLRLDAAALIAPAPPLPSSKILVQKPPAPPRKLFPSMSFLPDMPIEARPILTPDNYVDEVGPWLASARKSIYMEQQYIWGHQSAVRDLLSHIDPSLDVRIILAKGFEPEKTVGYMRQLESEFRLSAGTHIRLLNPRRFVHCHNKLIIVDGVSVLVGSQNWSNPAVLDNREASLLLRSEHLARYYTDIFNSDWEEAWETPYPPAAGLEPPIELMEADISDYV